MCRATVGRRAVAWFLTQFTSKEAMSHAIKIRPQTVGVYSSLHVAMGDIEGRQTAGHFF